MNSITEASFGMIRTADTIAAEINGIKGQVRASVLAGAVEIGKRLQEAKGLVPFGEWGNWLQLSVDYSERTAQNMMRIAEEYGKSNSRSLADLTYTQAVLLLSVPGDERETFVQEHPLEDMTTRELQAAVDALKAEKAQMRQTQEKSEARALALAEKLDRLEKEISKASELAKKAEAQGKKAAEARAAKLESELKVARAEADGARAATEAEKRRAADVAAKPATVPPEVEAELARLRAQASRGKEETELRAAFDALKDGFERLLGRLAAVEGEDPELAGKYRAAIGKGLRMMADRVSGTTEVTGDAIRT